MYGVLKSCILRFPTLYFYNNLKLKRVLYIQGILHLHLFKFNLLYKAVIIYLYTTNYFKSVNFFVKYKMVIKKKKKKVLDLYVREKRYKCFVDLSLKSHSISEYFI